MKKSATISLIAAGLLYSATSVAQLLNVVPAEPKFGYNAGGTTTFDAGTGVLEVDATPVDYSPTVGTTFDIFPLFISPNVLIRANLDANCNLFSGDPSGDDLQVIGDIDRDNDFVPEQSGTLLTGEISGFGIDTVGASSAILLLDAKFGVTGGELVTAGEYNIGDQVGVTIEVSNNDFAGDCTSSWLGGAKGNIGAIDDDPDPACCFDVVKAFFKDYSAHHACYGSGSGSHGSSGSYGSGSQGSGSGSKSVKKGSSFSLDLNVECKPGFDPTTDVVQLTLDGGETIDLTGLFEQKGSSGSKFKAKKSGKPKVKAVLDCAKGTLEVDGVKADFSQIDFSDGVGAQLVLGPDYDEMLNIPVMPYEVKCGITQSWKYKNPNPTDCVSTTPDPTCVTEWKKVKFKYHKNGKKKFLRAKGSDITETITLPAGATVDSSCGTAVTCRDTITDNDGKVYKIIQIDGKKNTNVDCDAKSTSDHYHGGSGGSHGSIHGSHGS